MTIVGDHGRPFVRQVFDDFEVFYFLAGPERAREALGGHFVRVLEGPGGVRGDRAPPQKKTGLKDTRVHGSI